MAKNSVKVTVLVDYTAKEGLETEHGFAAWVEIGDKHVLFDTGQLEVSAKQCRQTGN